MLLVKSNISKVIRKFPDKVQVVMDNNKTVSVDDDKNVRYSVYAKPSFATCAGTDS